MKDVDAVRKLIQWETMRMKKQFRADMWHFIPRIIALTALALLAIWGDMYLTQRFLHEAEKTKAAAGAQEAGGTREQKNDQAR